MGDIPVAQPSARSAALHRNARGPMKSARILHARAFEPQQSVARMQIRGVSRSPGFASGLRAVLDGALARTMRALLRGPCGAADGGG